MQFYLSGKYQLLFFKSYTFPAFFFSNAVLLFQFVFCFFFQMHFHLSSKILVFFFKCNFTMCTFPANIRFFFFFFFFSTAILPFQKHYGFFQMQFYLSSKYHFLYAISPVQFFFFFFSNALLPFQPIDFFFKLDFRQKKSDFIMLFNNIKCKKKKKKKKRIKKM